MDELKDLIVEATNSYKMPKKEQTKIFKRALALTDNQRMEELQNISDKINFIMNNLEDAYPDVTLELDDQDKDLLQKATLRIVELRNKGILIATTLSTVHDNKNLNK